MDLDQITQWVGIVGMVAVGVRTFLQALADGLSRFAIQMHMADMRDGREDWHWTAYLSAGADTLAALVAGLDAMLAYLPVRAIGKGK